MADGWGGAREGTPGKAYSNRTDLLTNRAPAATASAAAGGAQPAPAPVVTPDQTPTPRDTSAYPGEPVTTGLPSGPGAGPEVLTASHTPIDTPARRALRALMLVDDNPDLRRLLARLDMTGA